MNNLQLGTITTTDKILGQNVTLTGTSTLVGGIDVEQRILGITNSSVRVVITDKGAAVAGSRYFVNVVVRESGSTTNLTNCTVSVPIAKGTRWDVPIPLLTDRTKDLEVLTSINTLTGVKATFTVEVNRN